MKSRERRRTVVRKKMQMRRRKWPRSPRGEGKKQLYPGS
jgi:hypothetical protein